jgi:hypothetical protein
MDTAEDGRFSFHGLEGDPVRVEAWGPKGAAKAVLAEPKVLYDSDSDSDSASDELRLVLHATTTRTARVTSLGAPVPGALVLMMPLDFLASPRAMPLQNTDEHGVFEFGAPVSARAFGFLVSARGRPVRLGRAEMPPGQWAEGVPLEIQLPQESGTLVITDIPGVVLGAPEGLPRPVVVHGGFWFYAENLSTAGATRQGQTFTCHLSNRALRPPNDTAAGEHASVRAGDRLLKRGPAARGVSRSSEHAGGRSTDCSGASDDRRDLLVWQATQRPEQDTLDTALAQYSPALQCPNRSRCRHSRPECIEPAPIVPIPRVAHGAR